ncbi:hypothetical protein [Chroococcidiopsis sp.]|uniref:hypothetical protein n=1 Tax=Chroococcidiopsis sp. TaxID=3088168 RepID=UPI003F309F4B
MLNATPLSGLKAFTDFMPYPGSKITVFGEDKIAALPEELRLLLLNFCDMEVISN